MLSQENIDTFSNFPPLQKAVKLSTNLVCDRSASEVRTCLNDLIKSINKQLPVTSSLPKRRPSLSSRIAKHINALSTQNLTTKVPSRAPSRTPTTPRYPISPITPTTPTSPPRIPTTNHKSSQAILDNNNSNTSNQQATKPCYWSTLYILTKICLMDLEYWKKGEGHPVDRISESFFLQPKILFYYKEVKSLDLRKLIDSILNDLTKIQDVVLEKK